MLPLQNKISTRSTRTRTYRGSVVNFDNGYSQRVTRGPSSARSLDSWALVFDGLKEDDADELIAFLDLVGNWDTFVATMPKDTQEKTWRVVTSFNHSTRGPEFHTITFNIVQELA